MPPPPLRHCAAKAISGYPAACISCPPPPQLLQGDRKGRMELNGLGKEQRLQALGGAGESQPGKWELMGKLGQLLAPQGRCSR